MEKYTKRKMHQFSIGLENLVGQKQKQDIDGAEYIVIHRSFYDLTFNPKVHFYPSLVHRNVKD